MDLLKKLGASLASASQTEREYEIAQHPYSTAIAGNWKLFKGKPHNLLETNNNSAVTIWIAEKSNLDDLLLKFLKLGALNLQKLKHPNIVTVHKFEETSCKLYLVTERLVQSLNIFSHDKDKSYLKYLTSHIFDALEFIHGPAKLFHGNINNEHFYVTNSGIAKIAGFELSKDISSSSVPSDFQKIQNTLTVKGAYHQGNSLPKQDLYALGGEIAKIFSGDVGKELGKRTLGGVPFHFESDFSPKLDHDLRNLCKSLFSGSFVRLSKDSSLSIMTKLDQFRAQSEPEQRNSLIDLCKTENFLTLSNNLLIYRILPFLNLETDKYRKLKLKVLLMMGCRKSIADNEYNSRLIPTMLETIKDLDDVNLVMKFVQNGILEKSNVANRTRIYKSVVLKGLEQVKNKETRELACECVKNLEKSGSDCHSSTNEIDKLLIIQLGKIITGETDRLECRTKALVALGAITTRLEPVKVFEQVMPIFRSKIQDCESNAALAMCVNGILLIIVQKKTPTREVLAKVIIPALSPLTVCSGLNSIQFHSIMRTMNLATEELTRIQNKRLRNQETTDKVVKTMEPISIKPIAINPIKMTNISPVPTNNLPSFNQNFNQLKISTNQKTTLPSNNILTPKNQYSLTNELIKNSTPIKPSSNSNMPVFTGFQTSTNVQNLTQISNTQNLNTPNSNTPYLNNLMQNNPMQSSSANSSDLLDFLK